jgi:hypothetical protein
VTRARLRRWARRIPKSVATLQRPRQRDRSASQGCGRGLRRGDQSRGVWDLSTRERGSGAVPKGRSDSLVESMSKMNIDTDEV